MKINIEGNRHTKKVDGKISTDLQNSIYLVEKQSKLLAESIINIFNIEKSVIYLSTMLIPFLAHFMQNKKLNQWEKSNEMYFANFAEFYISFNGEEFYGPTKAFEVDIDWKSGDYDFVVTQPVNIYEKLIYLIFGISFCELCYKSYQKNER